MGRKHPAVDVEGKNLQLKSEYRRKKMVVN